MKTQALRLLPSTFIFPLSALIITPYVPVPETNGEEWDRLEPLSALDGLVELAIHGEYNGTESGKRTKDVLDLRAAAVAVFEVFHSIHVYMNQTLIFNDRTSYGKMTSRKPSSRRTPLHQTVLVSYSLLQLV